jgi:hypothetical protein
MVLLHTLWRFCNSRFFWGGFISPMPNPPTWRTRDYTSFGPYPSTCLAWVALPGAYTPTSIVLRVIGVCKPPLHDKVVVHEEELRTGSWIFSIFSVNMQFRPFLSDDGVALFNFWMYVRMPE